MKFLVLTLFPEMIEAVVSQSILGRAIASGVITITTKDIRDFAPGRHRKVDDYPYGGGSGLVMKADIVRASIAYARDQIPGVPVLYMSPQGKPFSQQKARKLAREEGLILLCGHYEGIDERIMDQVDEEVSLGDFVMTGGEIAALAVIDAVARLVPGVLGDETSAHEESFMEGLLEYPQYTRPPRVDGKEVPEVLLSGHHEQIRRWRLRQSLLRTLLKRPDLLLLRDFSAEEREILEDILFSRRQY